MSDQPEAVDTREISWRDYFEGKKEELGHLIVVAQGGTLDASRNAEGKLAPVGHDVSIEATQDLSASSIFERLKASPMPADTLGGLYVWSQDLVEAPSWNNVQPKEAIRISSFDSGQEDNPHFVAAALYFKSLLEKPDVTGLVVTQGTDTLVNKATLCAFLFLKRLVSQNKKLVFIGSPESGYLQNSLAQHNITGGLVTCLEDAVPAGIYAVSSKRDIDGRVTTDILPAFGSAKLHADGYFHTPNSGNPPGTIDANGEVTYSQSRDILQGRQHDLSLLPDFGAIYLDGERGVKRLENALETVALVSVENDPKTLGGMYKNGVRAVVVEARGSGTATVKWRRALEEFLAKGDTTALVITSADSGDVDLKKYAAGLDIDGALSGRTLRREAAMILTGIIHDLKKETGMTTEEGQKLIQTYCWAMGMINE